MKQKIIFIILLTICVTYFSYSQPKNTIDTEIAVIKAENESLERKFNDFEKNQKQFIELKNELAETKLNIATAKQAVYDSNINNLNLATVLIGFIFAIVGFFGYRNISGNIRDIKGDIKNDIRSVENKAAEIKNDINNRVSENRTDFKDLKKELLESFSCFEKRANEEIQSGLTLQLQEAIDRIMKGSLGKQIDSLNEQVAELCSTTEKIKADFDHLSDVHITPTTDEVINETNTSSTQTNAFEDEAK